MKFKMDAQAKAHLDEEFKKLLTKIRPYIISLTIPHYITSCRVWMEKLSLCEPEESAVRNEYLRELYRQIQSGKIEEPFSSSPPDGPLHDIILPESSTSWSDISSTSTRETMEPPPFGDALMEEAKEHEMENYYEKKFEEQQRLIDDLHQKNENLTKQLNINLCNPQASVGINIMASEVEYLKERLRELIMMKKNLQASHNAIIIQWETVTRELEFELRAEKQKNNELQIRINELENQVNNLPVLSDKIVREDIEKKILAEHTVEICDIRERQDEMIKTIEENNSVVLKQKEDEYENLKKQLKMEYETEMETIKRMADKDIKARDDEIERLEKIVEEKCDRSQMEQESICNHDALLEKVNFLHSCILKMDKLLRKYEKHYSKKVSVLTNELLMKENSMQIQLTTQRAQLMAKASTERQIEIEEIVFQLERRYRQLLEDQQCQVNEIRQDYSNIIKQLADKFEIKSNNS